MFLALVTYTCVNITWVFFRAREFDTAWQMIKSTLFLNPEGAKVLDRFDIIKVFTIAGALFCVHWFMRNTSVKEVASKISPYVLGFIWALMFFLIAISQGSGEQFIYFQF